MSTYLGVVAVFWVLVTLRFFRDVRALPSLPAHTSATEPLPRVSIVIAARDEEARIETTVRRLLAQQDVELELIIVDDRSTDRTGEIVARIANSDSRVKLVRVDTLPERWLGKCHACYLGAGSATGEWILFSDADIWMNPDVIARAVRVAISESAEHVCLLFGMSRGTLAGKACHLIATLSITKGASRLRTAKLGGYMGLGAFNLVRSSAYRAAGGHEPLRLTICDDWMLGLLMRRAGFSTRALLAAVDVEADWFGSPLGMIKAMQKNYFAAINFRVGRMMLIVMFYTLLWAGAIVGPFTGTRNGVAAGMAMMLTIIPAAMLARRMRLPLLAALLVPFVAPIIVPVMLNSAFQTLRHRGIRWRDTFYPLDLLRTGNYR
jgi:glycosyltransferase involved in cell wall biosynthesis